jgi:hypothetical protein
MFFLAALVLLALLDKLGGDDDNFLLLTWCGLVETILELSLLAQSCRLL